MLSNIQKRIIVRALRIREENGEEAEEVLAGYKNLSGAELEEVLAELREEEGEGNENGFY